MKESLKRVIVGVAMLLASVITVSGGSMVLTASGGVAGSAASAQSGSADLPLAHGTIKNADGKFVFTYDGKTYKNEYERVLAEDGFIYGVDWSWINDYAHGATVSLADHPLDGTVAILGGRFDYIKRSLYNMKKIGLSAFNVWIFKEGGGYVYDERGYVVGITDQFKTNLTLLLDACREIGIDFVPCLMSQDSAYPYQREYNGMTANELNQFYRKFYYDKDARATYIENVIRPTCEILKEYQDVIPIMGLTIENSSNINDTNLGWIYSSAGYKWDTLASFINELGKVSKEYMPDVPTSVEDIGWPDNHFRKNDLEYVDLVGMNNYSRTGTVPDRSLWFSNKDSYVGECNVSETYDYMASRPQVEWNDIRVKLFESAYRGGFVGAFYFNWMCDGGGAFDFFSGSSADVYADMQPFVVPLAYKIIDLKNEHRGIKELVDQPAMLYNNQSSTHYWIGGRGVARYDLEASVDGGPWEAFVTNLDPYECQMPNGLLSYKGPDMEPGKTYRFRIVSYLESGEKNISEPSNETSLYVPVEMFVDSKGNYSGGFEEGGWVGDANKEVSDGWTHGGWEDFGAFVHDSSIAHSGEWCLRRSPMNDIGSMGTYSAQNGYRLKVKPNTMYSVNFWYKQISRDTDEDIGSITVRNMDNQNLIWQGFGDRESTGEWKQSQTVYFMSPPDGLIRVVLMSMGDVHEDIYIDDFSIVEAR